MFLNIIHINFTTTNYETSNEVEVNATDSSNNTVFNSDEVNLDSPRGVVNGIYLYVGWLGDTISSLWDVGQDTISTVGHVVKVNASQVDKYRRE